ncbi:MULTISPECIES: cystathionine beta-synthase [Protofrankia]|uniref:Cystathionine beta-synthase n=1 Tax=Candidatus Protofrankia datiscae TaxID=2716812 RepID=F8AVE0_9ACTN|nr:MULTISPECIES: cystathionine beta-synthase [Protofrankia]AEH08236.1 cystathionine beta-synthase [Candidatus Protofrankia datiscae]
MRVYENLAAVVGGTPLIRLNAVTAGIAAPVFAKLEYVNPGGSVKDRIALAMIDAAEAAGQLRPGGTIVEPTSGNTGVGLAIVAAARGYRCVFTMPDKISEEKQAVLRAYGAEVLVCPTAVAPDDPRSYYSVARRVVAETPGAWSPDQYSNPHNPAAHHASTGPEIWADTDGRVTHFVAGIGTGGTISGTGRYLKEVSGRRVQVVGADPEGSVYSGGSGRPYLVEGVGEDIWPTTYDKTVVDRVEAVSDRDSFLMTRELARREGMLVGGSCGLAVVAALRVARELDADGCVVVLLPDSGRGYLSKIFNDEWMYDYGFLDRPSDEPTVAEVLARKSSDATSPPDLVHVHPDETVGAAISYLREYNVSQMPVVRQEPPLRSAEVAGAVIELELLGAVFADRTAVDAPVAAHMSPPLPTVGAGEPLSVLVSALGAAPAVLVLEDGNPVGILTRSDLLSFLATP